MSVCEDRGVSHDRLLFELVNALGNSLSLQETFGELDTRLRAIIPYHAMAVWTPGDHHLAAAYASGLEAPYLCALRIPLGPAAAESAGEALGGGLRSSLAVPLTHASAFVGALALYRRDENAFHDEHRGVLQLILPKAAAAIANAARYELAERLAAIDPESSLPNRRSLFLRLDAEVARARRHRSTLALLVCDCGRTPPWRALAAAFRDICREEDYVARMGDAVVLALAGFARPHLAEKQRQAKALLAAHGLPPNVRSAFFPDDGFYADDLLAAAAEPQPPHRT